MRFTASFKQKLSWIYWAKIFGTNWDGLDYYFFLCIKKTLTKKKYSSNKFHREIWNSQILLFRLNSASLRMDRYDYEHCI